MLDFMGSVKKNKKKLLALQILCWCVRTLTSIIYWCFLKVIQEKNIADGTYLLQICVTLFIGNTVKPQNVPFKIAFYFGQKLQWKRSCRHTGIRGRGRQGRFDCWIDWLTVLCSSWKQEMKHKKMYAFRWAGRIKKLYWATHGPRAIVSPGLVLALIEALLVVV